MVPNKDESNPNTFMWLLCETEMPESLSTENISEYKAEVTLSRMFCQMATKLSLHRLGKVHAKEEISFEEFSALLEWCSE